MVENSTSDSILSLVGGRELGWFVLAAAIVAHLLEALFAAWVCSALKFDAGAALTWTFLVFIVGFPVLQHIIGLQKIAKASSQ